MISKVSLVIGNLRIALVNRLVELLISFSSFVPRQCLTKIEGSDEKVGGQETDNGIVR